MSEFINNSSQRKELLRHMLVRLHEGESPDLLRNRLIEVLRGIPYNEVVEVEQELIDNAILSEEEILEFCDLHTAVLDGSIDLEGAKEVPAGHPVDTFKQENVALRAEIEKYYSVREQIQTIDDSQVTGFVLQLRTLFNNFSDVDKHYKRKEYLLFPYMEKHLITGPPKVMWGKHDETRAALTDGLTLNKGALSVNGSITINDWAKDENSRLVTGIVTVTNPDGSKDAKILAVTVVKVISAKPEVAPSQEENPEFDMSKLDSKPGKQPQAQEGSKTQAKAKSHIKGKRTAPKTGDSNSAGIYLALLGLSAFGIVALKRKWNN